MKIAIFSSYMPPHIGGIEVVADSQAKALAAAGHTVTVVSSSSGAEAGVTKINGYKLCRISAWNYFERTMDAAFPIFSPSLLWRSCKVVRGADIVHAHDAFYFSSLVAAFWAKIFRKPLILTQHVEMVTHPRKVVRLVQKLVYATTGKFVIKSSTKIIVLNSRVEKFLIDMHVGRSKIIFLPNGVDTELFSPADNKQKQALRHKYNLPADKTLALFVGRFVPKKGFSKLIDVETLNGLAVVFVGGNNPDDYTRQDHFFLGRVGRKDIADVFRMCDFFVLPSEAEGFPVAIQEAMASGLPVITTDDPAYRPYDFSRKGIALIKSTTQNIREIFSNLLLDNETQILMSKFSRDYALKNFDNHKQTKDLLGVYHEALV